MAASVITLFFSEAQMKNLNKQARNKFKSVFFQTSFLSSVSDNRNLRCLKKLDLGDIGSDMDFVAAYTKCVSHTVETVRQNVRFWSQMRELESQRIGSLVYSPTQVIHSIVLSADHTEAFLKQQPRRTFIVVDDDGVSRACYAEWTDQTTGILARMKTAHGEVPVYGQSLYRPSNAFGIVESAWSFALVRPITELNAPSFTLAWRWFDDPKSLSFGVRADMSRRYLAIPIPGL